MTAQSYGKYQLLKKLATGGMAEVWLARQTGIEGFHKNVVIKRILPHLAEDREFVEMFRNEALIAARFNHPNIAQVYEFGEANGTYYIAMEYIHGEDLGRIMRKAYTLGQWIARPLAIRIVASACEGLYYAHTRTDERGNPLRVVHRDISPQNILISFDGAVKLVDFGIAKAADQASLTKSGAIKGKFAYMAPEQAAGKPLDHRADIFAIGLVLYELLTGVRPLKRETELGTLQAALECKVEPPSAVADMTTEMDSAVMQALSRAVDDRYRDARQFQLSLEEMLVRQGWVAGSVQLAELMETLFADRLAEERRQETLPAESDDSRAPSIPEVSSSPSHVSWDAQEPPRADREPPTQAASMEVEETNWQVETGWQAPVEEVAPRRRTGTGTPASSRGASRTEMEPAPPRRTSSRVSQPGQTGSRRALSGQSRARPVEELEDDEPTQMPDMEPPPPPPRRRTGQSTPAAEAPRRRTSSRAEVARASTSGRIRKLEGADSGSKAEQGASRAKLLKVGAVAVAALVLLLLVAVFREPLWKVLNRSAKDGQGITLNVISNQRVKVYVEHTERCGVQGRTELGETPLRNRQGAHVQDTLILENKQLGIFDKEEVPFGEPNEVKTVQKTYALGRVQIKVVPARRASNLRLFRDGVELGPYTPELAVELMDGIHHLELRGAQLSEPVPVDVEVKAGDLTTIGPVDLRPYLAP